MYSDMCLCFVDFFFLYRDDDMFCVLLSRKRHICTATDTRSEPSCDMFLCFVVDVPYSMCFCCVVTVRAIVRNVLVLCFRCEIKTCSVRHVLELCRCHEVQLSVFKRDELSSSSEKDTKVCVFVVLRRRRHIGTSAAKISKRYMFRHPLRVQRNYT